MLVFNKYFDREITMEKDIENLEKLSQDKKTEEISAGWLRGRGHQFLTNQEIQNLQNIINVRNLALIVNAAPLTAAQTAVFQNQGIAPANFSQVTVTDAAGNVQRANIITGILGAAVGQVNA